MHSLTPWILSFSGFKYISIPDNLLKDPLCSWGFHLIVSYLTFLEGSPKLSSENEGALRANWYGGSNPIFLEVSLLSPGYLVHPTAIVWCNYFGIIIGPLVPFWKGIPIFWRYCCVITSGVLGSLLPTFWYLRPLTKKLSLGGLPFYLTGYISCFCISFFSIEKYRLR